MAFYRCGGGNIKQVTVNVTSTDFPDLFKYIDIRDKAYVIASEDKKVISVSYEIVTGNKTYSASSIAFRECSSTSNKALVNKPSTGTLDKIFNGLTIYMHSTVADSDLHFAKLSYTYIQL